MAKVRKPARVRTAEGVDKYDAPIGALITGKTKNILARLNARLVGLDDTNQGTLPGMEPKQLGLFSVPDEPKIPKPKAVDPKPKPKPTRKVEELPASQLDVDDSLVIAGEDWRITAAQRGDTGATQFRIENAAGMSALSAIFQPGDTRPAVRSNRPGRMLPPTDIDVADTIVGPDGSKNRVVSVTRSRYGSAASFMVERPDGTFYSVPVAGHETVRAIPLTPEEREAFRNRPRVWAPNMTFNRAYLMERGDVVFEDGERFELDQNLSPSTRNTVWTVVDSKGNRSTRAFIEDDEHKVLRINNDDDRRAWLRENGFEQSTYGELQGGDEVASSLGGRQAVVRVDQSSATGEVTVFVSTDPDDVGRTLRNPPETVVMRRPGGGNKSERIRNAMRQRRADIEDYEANYLPTKSKDLRTGDEIKLDHDGTPQYVISAKYDPDLDEVTMVTLDSRTNRVMTMLKDGDTEWRVKAGGARTAVDEFLVVEEARLDVLRTERSEAPTVSAGELELNDVVYWNNDLVKYQLTAVRQTGDGTANITMRVVDGDNSFRVGETFGQRVGGNAEFHRVVSGAQLRAERIQRAKEEADVITGEDVTTGDLVYDPITKSWARVDSVEDDADGNYVLRGYLIDVTNNSDQGADYLLTVTPDDKVRIRERNADQIRAAARNVQQRQRRIAQREAEKRQAREEEKMVGERTTDISISDLQRGQVVNLAGDGPVRVLDIERQGDFTTITGYNTTGVNKGTVRVEGTSNPDDGLILYPDHAERPLPPLPPEAAQIVAAKEIVVGDKLPIQTTTQVTEPIRRPVTRNVGSVPEGATLPAYGGVTFLEVVRLGRSSYDDTTIRVRELDGSTSEISVPTNVSLVIEGKEADAARQREPGWYGGGTTTETFDSDVRVDSVRVLANGKIRVKGEYLTGPDAGKKYSDLLPPNKGTTVIRQPRNGNGELLNARQNEALNTARKQLEMAKRSYERAQKLAVQDADAGIRTRHEELGENATIRLRSQDAFGADRAPDLVDRDFTVIEHRQDEEDSDYRILELKDEDGDLYDVRIHRNETVLERGEGALQRQLTSIEQISGTHVAQMQKNHDELVEKIDREGTWGGIPLPRRRAVNTNNGSDRYRGKPWGAPDTFSDIADMEELFNMDEDELMEELQKMDGPWGDGEVTLEIYSVDEAAGYGNNSEDGEIYWKGYLYKDGNRVGHIARKYRHDYDGELTVYNDYLWIDDSDAKGHGVGTVFYAEMDDWYRRSGVNRMEIQAVQDGGYAWGMAGFDWWPEYESSNNEATDVMGDRLRRYLDDNGISVSGGDEGYGTYDGHTLDSDGEYWDDEKHEYVRPDPDDIEYPDGDDGVVNNSDLPADLVERLVDYQRRLRSNDGDDWPTPNEVASLRYDTGRVYPASHPKAGEPVIENIGKLLMQNTNWRGQYFF